MPAALPARPRSRLVAALCGWHLFCVSLSYAVVGDAPLFAVMILIVAAISALVPRSTPVTVRYFAYTITVAVLLTVIFNSAYPVDGDRFFVPISTELTFPVVMTIACGMLFLEQRPAILGGILALGLTMFMLQGATVNDPSDHVRLTISGNALWRDRFRFFALVTILQLPAILGILHHARHATRVANFSSRKRSRGPWLAAVAALILLTCATSWMMNRYFRVFDSLAQELLNNKRHRQVAVFDDHVDLRRTINAKRLPNASETVFFVHAKQPPGYLRGFAYATYEDGQWQTDDTSTTVMPQIQPGVASSLFALTTSQPPSNATSQVANFDVFPRENFRSEALLVPGNAKQLELIADSVSVSPHGTVRARNETESAGWRVTTTQLRQGAAWPNPEPPPATLLQVPAELAAELQPLLVECLRGAPEDTERKIRHVAAWVRNRHTYSLEVELPNDRDPVLAFLRDLRSGHCELYASATVQLLRLAGIPARYVTGYFTMSPAGRGDWYAGRRIDCHAWVEAWDGNQWLLVEPTPASGVPATNQPTAAEALRLAVATFFKDLMANLERGYFAAAVTAALKSLGSGFAYLFYHGPWYLTWPLAIALLWLLHRRLSRNRRHAELQQTRDHLRQSLSPLLRQLESHGIVAQPATTIHELATMVAASRLSARAECVRLLRRYESMRFGANEPDSATTADFAREVAAVQLNY